MTDASWPNANTTELGHHSGGKSERMLAAVEVFGSLHQDTLRAHSASGRTTVPMETWLCTEESRVSEAVNMWVDIKKQQQQKKTL